MNISKEELRNAKRGDIIEFGEILWYVLENQSGCALIISRYSVAYRPFNNRTNDSRWDTSSLRKWLNRDFYSVFTDDEAKLIGENTSRNETTERGYGKIEKFETTDKIFLLDKSEAEYYISGKIPFYDGDMWLRSPGVSMYRSEASCLSNFMNVHVSANPVTSRLGVHPVMKLMYD